MDVAQASPRGHKRTGFDRVRRAVGHSLNGLRAAWHHEAAFRQELVAIALLLPVAMLADVSGLERALLLFSLLAALVVELVNSAIEAAIDRIGLDDHPLSGRAKDLGSAAVMVSLIMATLVWLCIFLPGR